MLISNHIGIIEMINTFFIASFFLKIISSKKIIQNKSHAVLEKDIITHIIIRYLIIGKYEKDPKKYIIAQDIQKIFACNIVQYGLIIFSQLIKSIFAIHKISFQIFGSHKICNQIRD